jgi:hypothetical protein
MIAGSAYLVQPSIVRLQPGKPQVRAMIEQLCPGCGAARRL